MITLIPFEVAALYAVRVPDLRQHGKRWRGTCPIHAGKGASFSVDSVTGLWRCWSDCGRGGDIIALEIAFTGAAWLDSVAEIERIVGRPLLDRPASRVERWALAEHLARDRREMQEAEFWRIGVWCMAEQILDELPDASPDRFAPTQLLMSPCAAHGAVLLALFRDACEIDTRLAAALVYAGERAWQRRCEALARFIAAGAEVKNAA